MNWQKGGEVFGEFIYACLFMHVYFLIYEKGGNEFGGASMKFIFNPCIYNSIGFVIIKMGKIVDPKTHHFSFDDD